MVFPGFGGRTEGAEALIAGFQDFCQNAKTLSYAESGHQVDLAGNSAVNTLSLLGASTFWRFSFIGTETQLVVKAASFNAR